MGEAKWVCSVLPTTALSSFPCLGRHAILAGKGSYVECLDSSSGTLLAIVEALEGHSVHGITILQINARDSHCEGDVLVYGGRHVAWLKLCIDVSGVFSLIRVHLTSLADWILCSKTDSERSGSVVLLTSYNAFYRAALDPHTNEVNLQCLNSTLSTFLYSADILQVDFSNFIIASGTAFGEILTWTCKLDEAKRTWLAYAWRDLRSHKGSIFGLSISHTFTTSTKRSCRLLASCSDDRTITIWDITDITEGAALINDQHEDVVTSTLFAVSEQCLASTWAHLSRIWNVSFVAAEQRLASSPQLLVSTAEDGQAQAWRVVIENDVAKLINTHADRHHAGKNVWSDHVYSADARTALLSGGADGRIASRSYNDDGNVNAKQHSLSYTFKQISAEARRIESSPSRLSCGNITFKSYAVLQRGTVAAATDRGSLMIHRCDDLEGWQTIFEADTPSTYLILSNKPSHNRLVFGNPQDGKIYLYDVHSKSVRHIWQQASHKMASITITWSRLSPASKVFAACIAVKCHAAAALTLLWLEANDASTSIQETHVRLPESFDVSSAVYDDRNKVLLCGTRSGAIAVWVNLSCSVAEVDHALCLRHVHGSDTVTSINKLKDDYFITTGRDGTYCIIRAVTQSAQQTDSLSQLQIVHRGVPPLGPNIEGVEMIQSEAGSPELIFYGFKSIQFIAWNESSQTQFLSVDCGGAHRNWAFACHNLEVEGSTFVWTKAGAFMIHEQESTDHAIVQHGGHGREIKALAVWQVSTHKLLIATGSEDTDIRLFEYRSKSKDGNNLRNVAIIRKHTTGLQDLMFLEDGRTLISAAGMEELYAWRLSEVPVIGQGVILAATMPRQDTQSDSRIMAVSSKKANEATENNTFIIAAALSNGQLRVIRYSDSTTSVGENEAAFEILQRIDFGTTCLTQVHLSAQVDDVLTGATNGFITSQSFRIATASRKPSSPDVSALPILSYRVQQQIHQNSITAMQRCTISAEHDLLITGGDDNAVALTLMTHLHPNTNIADKTMQTMVIPKAHAAAVTALTAIQIQLSPLSLPKIMLFTAANDQKINIWSITFDDAWYKVISEIESGLALTDAISVSSKHMDHVHISLLDEIYTNVADISGIDVLQYRVDAASNFVARVIVVGVGMEILEIAIDL